MKRWYTSKTLFVNVLMLICVGAQIIYKVEISSEAQAAFITIVNILLRIITKEGLSK